MARFEELAAGTLARDKGVSFTSLDGRQWTCDLGLLTAADDLVVIERASDFARSKKAKAEQGDPLFDFACACEIVALVALDPESPADAPRTFFTSGEQVRRALDRDRVHYLQERQAAFQESRSPLKRSLTDDEYQAKILELARRGAADANPFEGWAPSLVVDLATSMARLCLASVTSKLLSGGKPLSELSQMIRASRHSSTESSS